jgi:hypothetical protein
MKTTIAWLALCGAMPLAWAQQGSEFLDQKVSKLATSDADYLCERLYDSASPVGMLAELALIVGPRVLLQKVPDVSGISPQENKELFDKLRVLARRKVWLPVSAETQVGSWLNDKYVRDGAIIASDKLNSRDRQRFEEIRKTLDAIVGTLPADNPYKFTLQVVQGDQSNASIGVGGYVYLNLGLVRDRSLNANDIALRLAHEVAHLTRRHALKDIQLKVIDAMAAKKDIQGMLSIATNPVKTMQDVLGTANSTMLLFQRFDQNQELEGDACGMYLLSRTPGIDARAALKAYEARKPLTTPESWDTSHPSHEERQFVMTVQLDPAQREQAIQRNKSGGGPRTPPLTGNAPAAAPTTPGGATTPAVAPATAAPESGGGGIKGLFESIKRAVPSPASAPAGGSPGITGG